MVLQCPDMFRLPDNGPLWLHHLRASLPVWVGRRYAGVAVFWLMVGHILSTLLDFVTCSQQPGKTKDLETLLLRYQLRILQRTLV